MTKVGEGALSALLAEIDALKSPDEVEPETAVVPSPDPPEHAPNRPPSPATLALIAAEIQRRKAQSETAKAYDAIDLYRKTPEGRDSLNWIRRQEYADEVRETHGRPVRRYRKADATLPLAERVAAQKRDYKNRQKEALTTDEEREAARAAQREYMRDYRARRAKKSD